MQERSTILDRQGAVGRRCPRGEQLGRSGLQGPPLGKAKGPDIAADGSARIAAPPRRNLGSEVELGQPSAMLEHNDILRKVPAGLAIAWPGIGLEMAHHSGVHDQRRQFVLRGKQFEKVAEQEGDIIRPLS